MVEASDPNDIFGVVIVFLTCQALSKAPKIDSDLPRVRLDFGSFGQYLLLTANCAG